MYYAPTRGAIVSARYTYVSFASNILLSSSSSLLRNACRYSCQFRGARKRSFTETLTRSWATFLNAYRGGEHPNFCRRVSFLPFSNYRLFESLIALMYVIIRRSLSGLCERIETSERFLKLGVPRQTSVAVDEKKDSAD